MKFSLILATVGRYEEVARFLTSLDAQDYRNFELIVIDQNDDERLTRLLAMYREKFPVRHVRSERGLSRARNVGLQLADGDVIAFPDDDCWYPLGLLQKVASELNGDPDIDGITGRFTDGDGRSEGRWLDHSTLLNRYNIWRGAISFSIFLRRRVVDAVGSFNASLGVGSRHALGRLRRNRLPAAQPAARLQTEISERSGAASSGQDREFRRRRL